MPTKGQSDPLRERRGQPRGQQRPLRRARRDPRAIPASSAISPTARCSATSASPSDTACSPSDNATRGLDGLDAVPAAMLSPTSTPTGRCSARADPSRPCGPRGQGRAGDGEPRAGSRLTRGRRIWAGGAGRVRPGAQAAVRGRGAARGDDPGHLCRARPRPVGHLVSLASSPHRRGDVLTPRDICMVPWSVPNKGRLT